MCAVWGSVGRLGLDLPLVCATDWYLGTSVANQTDMCSSAINHRFISDCWIWFTGIVRSRGNLLLSMDERGHLVALQGLWTKLFQIASRRDVLAASVVGLCGFGLFLGTRRFLALTPAEQRLLRESGSDPFCNEESTDRR